MITVKRAKSAGYRAEKYDATFKGLTLGQLLALKNALEFYGTQGPSPVAAELYDLVMACMDPGVRARCES